MIHAHSSVRWQRRRPSAGPDPSLRRIPLLPAAAAIALAVSSVPAAHASWQPGGNLVNSLGHGTRLHPVTEFSAVRPESDAVAGAVVAVSSTATVSGARGLDLIAAGNGDAILVFEDARNSTTSGTDIFAQRLNAALDLLWSSGGAAVCDVPLAQLGPVALADGANGVFVLWRDGRSGSGESLLAARLGPDGLPVAGWAAGGVMVRPGTSFSRLRLLSAGAGAGAIVGAQDYPHGGPAPLYLDRLHADGAVDTQWHPGFIPSLASSFDLVSDGVGGAFVSWVGWPYRALHALRIGSDGGAAPGWDPGGSRVDADRNAGPSGSVATLAPGLAGASPGRAFVVFDQQVHPWCGTSEVCYDSYTYAQYLGADGVVPFLGSLISALALAGHARLDWSVSGRDAVTIERRQEQTAWVAVGDGRRVSKREVGALGSGSHTVRLTAAGALGPGIYQVRLTRDGHSLTAKAVVTR